LDKQHARKPVTAKKVLPKKRNLIQWRMHFENLAIRGNAHTQTCTLSSHKPPKKSLALAKTFLIKNKDDKLPFVMALKPENRYHYQGFCRHSRRHIIHITRTLLGSYYSARFRIVLRPSEPAF
jgi:hypothetical protein